MILSRGRAAGRSGIKLPAGPRIRYTRKSTEEADRQVASHDQQAKECDKHFGEIPTAMVDALGDGYWFRDDKSGTTFDRPAFKRMIDFCLAHPQGALRGAIEVYDHSRWGRPVKKDKRGRIVGVDIKAFYRFMYRLEDAGWDIVFTTGEKNEDELAAFLKEGIEIYIAGQKSANLSREVTRGKLDWMEKGRWLGGPPPFPAKRVHPETGTFLPPGVRAYNGGSVLAVDEERLPHWLRAADQFLKGWSPQKIAEDFNSRGVPNYMTGRTRDGRRPSWSNVHITKILTNRALIGEIVYDYLDPDTDEVKTQTFKAAWEPIVPVDTFNAVQKRFEERSTGSRGPRRKSAQLDYITPLVCGHCGTFFMGTDTKRKDGSTLRRYRHQIIETGSTAAREAKRAAGCRAWQVDADEIEEAIKDLIVQQRMSPGFMGRLREMLADREEFAGATDQRVAEAKADVARVEKAQQEALRLKLMGQEAGLSDEMFVQQLKQLQEDHKRAIAAYEEALDFQKSAVHSQESVWEMFNETQAIVDRWEEGNVDERRALFSWWVDGATIRFEDATPDTRGKAKHERADKGTLGQRSSKRKLYVFLSTVPTFGLEVEMSPAHWNAGGDFPGVRKWEQVEVRMSPQGQWSEGSETSTGRIESAVDDHNAHSRTAHCGGCRC